MRKTTASLFAGVAAAILAGAGLGGTAFAASAPLVQECSTTTTTGGSLVNGVCDMPGAVVGSDDYYSYINASNNDAADRFSIVSGSLPPGLTMPAYLGVADTVIEGDAIQAGTYTFVVHAADPNGGLSSNQTYSITAADLACPSDPNGGTATGGVCVLPAAAVGQPGQTDDELTGTPTTAGTYVFTMQVTDALGDTASGQVSITINPRPPLKISEPAATGPAGTVGTYTFTMRVSDYDGQQATQQFSLTINP